MSEQQGEHTNLSPDNESETSLKLAGEQDLVVRRKLLKAVWIAPVVFSVAASPVFAASQMSRR